MMYEDDGLPQVEASIKALKEKMTIKDEFKDELEQTYALDIESLKAHDFVYPACGSSNSAIKLSLDELEKISKPVKWVNVGKGKDE